jgi:hypothetical protein
VTSRSDATDRFMAAQQLFTALNAVDSGRGIAALTPPGKPRTRARYAP